MSKRSEATAADSATSNNNKLLDALYLALPFVEDAEADTAYKRGFVKRAIATIRAAIADAEGRTSR